MLLSTIKFLMKRLFRVEINGTYQGGVENGQQKTLIIANHSSFIDGILLLLFLPTKPVFVIHEESEKSVFFRFFLRYVDYLTVDSAHPMAMRQVIKIINSGTPAVIFPEGRITVTGTLMKLYSGAAFAAIKTGATLIPVQISGAQFTYFSRLGRLFNLRAFPQVRLTIFPPTRISITDNNLDSDQRRELAKDQMHSLMMNMVVKARHRITLYEHLLESVKVHGSDQRLFQDSLGDKISYGEMLKKTVSLSILLQRKLDLDKRVGVMLPNSNACAIAFYALQHMGKTPVMINYTSGSRSVLSGLIATETKTILTSRRFIKKGELQSLVEAMSDYDIVYLEDLRKTVTFADKLSIAVQRNFPKYTAVKQNPEDEALVLFTSGTEGLPKGVLHSHDGLMTQIAQIKAIYDFNPQDCLMLCLPVFHVFGLMAALVLPFAAGASGFLYPTPLHYKVIPELIYEHNCTVIFSTSTFLGGYARFAEPYDFHSLRYVISGAEKLSFEVVKTYHEKFGIRILEGYGATETAPVIAANTPMEHRRGSVGRIIPGMEAELAPVPGIQGAGRLIVRAENIMIGYLRAEHPGVIEYTATEEGRRVYDTGDIAEIDADGFVHLRGRVKRFAKIAGEMVSLDTVEKMAIHSSPEASHAAISVEDRRKGERLHLFTTDPQLNRKKLQQAAKQLGIPKLAVPKSIQVIDNIPVFANGKTNYPELTESLKT
ncbi:MAG: bifunctional 2-acylglycerophosphoethanolamine acyltransferase/acyl-ACP synthetase [Gammaproteobacteria bacterium]|nr:MAG: bifunctional 2-acylglycerophosphoethanolamine acyltransferase/acyl-ACP synthetase [Gammaproteobacteria bacterium]